MVFTPIFFPIELHAAGPDGVLLRYRRVLSPAVSECRSVEQCQSSVGAVSGSVGAVSGQCRLTRDSHAALAGAPRRT